MKPVTVVAMVCSFLAGFTLAIFIDVVTSNATSMRTETVSEDQAPKKIPFYRR